MKLIVGLGNPEPEYAWTRHNVGCEVLRQLVRRHRVIWKFDHLQHGFVHGNWPLEHTTVKLLTTILKPSRKAVPFMMNQFGEALAVAVRTWRVAFPDILIVCDDVNLPLGTLRLRPQGRDGGHHGLASCLGALGTQEVARLRIGVGVQPLPRDLTEFVLSPFDETERPTLKRVLAHAVEACERWATEGIEIAMNRVNVREP